MNEPRDLVREFKLSDSRRDHDRALTILRSADAARVFFTRYRAMYDAQEQRIAALRKELSEAAQTREEAQRRQREAEAAADLLLAAASAIDDIIGEHFRDIFPDDQMRIEASGFESLEGGRFVVAGSMQAPPISSAYHTAFERVSYLLMQFAEVRKHFAGRGSSIITKFANSIMETTDGPHQPG